MNNDDSNPPLPTPRRTRRHRPLAPLQPPPPHERSPQGHRPQTRHPTRTIPRRNRKQHHHRHRHGRLRRPPRLDQLPRRRPRKPPPRHRPRTHDPRRRRPAHPRLPQDQPPSPNHQRGSPRLLPRDRLHHRRRHQHG